MGKKFRSWIAASAALLVIAAAAGAAEVSFKDPTGDDFGPGNYTYPTDIVYKPGSFDLTGMKLEVEGKKGTVEVMVNSALEDPWGMKVGFAVQMIFVCIDKDGKEGSGFTDALPGLNVKFAAADAWEKCIVLSPQGASRVKSEAETKAGKMLSAVIVPSRVKGSNRSIVGTFDATELGEGDPASWGYQVLVQSNEGFPAATDLLTRKVNEYEGQHRFGGGNDGDCDAHVMDVLAGKGSGDAAEVEAQKNMLKYECNPDGSAKQMATLTMVRK